MAEKLESVFIGGEPIESNDADLEVTPEEMGLAPEGENNEPQAAESVPEPETKVEPEPEPEPAGGEGGETKEEKAEVPDDVGGVPEQPEPEPESHGSVSVPKARLDKALRDKRALENRIAQLESQQQSPEPQQQQQQQQQQAQAEPVQPVVEMVSDKEIAEALLDGDLDKHAELQQKQRQQLRDEMRREILQEVNSSVPTQVTEQQQAQAFQTTRQELETEYEFLDPHSEKFDQDIVDTIAGFARGFTDRGYMPADALQEAAEKVLRIEKPDLFHVEQPDANSQAREAKRNERMNIDQKLTAAQSQAPDVSHGEMPVNPVPDFQKMSQDDFDKIPDSQLDEYLEQMRGE